MECQSKRKGKTMDTIGNTFKLLQGEGWANQSDGHVDSPTGFFYIIDMSSERNMMVDVLNDAGEDGETVMASISSDWWVVREDSQGFCHYNTVENESSANRWFDANVERFSQWSDDSE